MVRIRLRRMGAPKQPSYRVVAADKEAPRDGRFLEILGYYNPRTQPATIELKEDRIYHWLSVGAQPSESVEQIFNEINLRDRFKRFKEGEELEDLLAEAEKVVEDRAVDPRTRRDDIVSKKGKKQKASAAETEPEAEVEA